MSLLAQFQGRQTQFYVELLYGLLFVGGFAYLIFRVDPRVAAFEGGLVVGYLLRIWEKMSIYERILQETISEEAETRVADELEEQVPDEVALEVEQQVGEEVERQIEDEIGDLDAEIDERVAESIEAAEEGERTDGAPR